MSGGEPEGERTAPEPAEGLDPTLQILYGTETGNAEYLAMQLGKAAADRELAARVASCDELTMAQLARSRHAIFVVSTAGDGDMPFTAEEFWLDLVGHAAPDLPHLRFAVLALGDSSYFEFCAAGRELDERLEELGATRVLERLDCDLDYEITSEPWVEAAIPAFAELLRPYRLGTIDPAASTGAVRGGGRPWFAATLADRRELARRDPEREITHYAIELDRAEIDWQPGDSLNLRPSNEPALVDEVLDALSASGEEPLGGERGTPAPASATSAPVPAGAPVEDPAGAREPRTLREMLAGDREIRLLSREFIGAVAERAGSRELDELLAARDPALLDRWRGTHDLLQVLREHPAANFGGDELRELLRPLQPRAYSVASSPLLSASTVDLTVRTVRYRSGGRRFLGVASGALSERLAVGDRLALQHAPNPGFRLPQDPDADVIMIGPGVGVAPFRGFLQHREARGDRGRNWLFCGIRDPQEDLLYGEDLFAWRDRGVLDAFDVCASRVGERQYVQHRIAERGAELVDWLQGGATLYVCGDAAHMAREVQLAVRAAAAARLGSVARGEGFMERLLAERRYLQDVY